MQIGFVGLGRMGRNMTRRLAENGHDVLGFDRLEEAAASVAGYGVVTHSELAALVRAMRPPRAVWIMVPAGEPTELVLAELRELLEPGDLIVDGGNSNYRDTMRRSDECLAQQIALLDAGTSGGIWGYEEGFCLMVGGAPDAFERIEPVLQTLAPPGGYAYVGASGAGHYAKMIHNGIEYGMLQAYGEGFDILAASGFDFDLRSLAALWQNGSVVRSWLLELLERALASDPRLESVRGFVNDSGEGRWTVQEAIDLDVPAPVITLSLFERFASRRDTSFSAKVIAALRREFGGHEVRDVTEFEP